MHKYLLSVITVVACLCALSLSSQPALAQTGASGGGDIVVQTIPGPSIAEKAKERSRNSWPWYVARASGLVAAVSLVILMLSGMGLVTGYTFRVLEPLTAWATHRALGIVFGLSVIAHMGSLLFDHFAPFSIAQLLVPWLSDFRPITLFGVHVGSLYIALGILAFYGTALVVITSLVWVEKKPVLWKLVHLLSYIVILFVFIHALYLGTDLAHGLLRWVWIISGIVIACLVIHRLWRAKTT